jgi:hypothetical protein
MQRLSLSAIILVIIGTRAAVWECELPGLFKECYDFYSRIARPYNTPAYAVQSRCINSYLWKTSFVRYHTTFTADGLNYIRSLQREIEVKRRYSRYKRQAGQPLAVRREIRTLSDAEREAFFNAVNILKGDGVSMTVFLNYCKRFLKFVSYMYMCMNISGLARRQLFHSLIVTFRTLISLYFYRAMIIWQICTQELSFSQGTKDQLFCRGTGSTCYCE